MTSIKTNSSQREGTPTDTDIYKALLYEVWLGTKGQVDSSLSAALRDYERVGQAGVIQMGPIKRAASTYTRNVNIEQELRDTGRACNRTVIVQIFAGTGAGKTTLAYLLAGELMKKNYSVEHAGDFMSEKRLFDQDSALGSFYEKHTEIYLEQLRRVCRLEGKVDIIVCDYPPLLSAVYLKKDGKKEARYEKIVSAMLEAEKALDTFNVVLDRGERHRDVKESCTDSVERTKAEDREVKAFLKNNKVQHGVYGRNSVELIAENISRYYQGISWLPKLVPEIPTYELAKTKIDALTKTTLARGIDGLVQRAKVGAEEKNKNKKAEREARV